MKIVIAILSGIVLLSVSVAASAQASSSGRDKISPELRSLLDTLPSDQPVTVIVRLIQQTNLKQFSQLNKRSDRLLKVEQALRNKAAVTQRNLISLLESGRAQGRVSQYTSFWVFNGLSVTALPDMVLELAAQTEVVSITADEADIAPSTGAAEPNLAVIGVPYFWDLGMQGQGIVIASLDSGVDINHPELALRWRGGGNSWFDPYGQHPTTPTDMSGHGTWAMGIMLAGGAGGTSIGVAPQAQWIAAKIFNDRNRSTATAIHQAFQWVLDPDGDPNTADAPHVVNNSWAYGSPGCNLEFQLDLQSLNAVGILPVFAAGNFGPGTSTSVSPANYPEAFAVGATDNLDQIYGYSGRGPSACGEASTIYPELTAPGVDIKTTDLFGLYTSTTGTSIAAPHVSGSLALLLSQNSDMTSAQQRQALIASAHDLGSAGTDNTYGYGRLDLAEAYNWMPSPNNAIGPVTSNIIINPNPNNATQTVSISAVVNAPYNNGLQSNIAACEYFINNIGANGSGISMTANDGNFDSPVEGTVAYLSPAQLAALGEGTHTLYIHALDSAGNWGSPTSEVLLIDTTPPSVASLSATIINSIMTLSGTAADPAPGSIAQAEWFEGTADPGVGLANAMTVSGQNLSATTDTSRWVPGPHTLSVRVKDSAGNWSFVASSVVNVPDVVFDDGFETGDFSAWNGGVTGTRIGVTGASKMVGSYGMQAILGSNTTPGFVTDGSPANEASYHARFYFNPNSVNPAKSTIDLLSGVNSANTMIFNVLFRLSASSYQVSAAVLTSGGTSFTQWFPIADKMSHSIEIAWQSGTNAAFNFYIDGVLRQTLTNLNTGSYLLESVKLGPSAGLVKNASGTLYFDAFASTRTTVIGP